MTLAMGGSLANIAMLRAQPELSGPAASDSAVSRLVTCLAADAPRALKAIRAARAAARERAYVREDRILPQLPALHLLLTSPVPRARRRTRRGADVRPS